MMLLTHTLGLVLASGPFDTSSTTFNVNTLDRTNQHVDVVYPKEASNRKEFPLIVYAHGFTDSGYATYTQLFEDMASWGYVIAAPLSCRDGCFNCKSLPGDPPCFGRYYEELFKTVEWARSMRTLPINRSSGVALAGHSMGGQATLLASADANVTSFNIKASAMHHAFTHTYPSISEVPFLAFTGTRDQTAPPSMSEEFFNASKVLSRGIVNKIGANHEEPSSSYRPESYRPEIALYTVAWFKLYLDGTPKAEGVDWNELIHGSGPASICGGGDGAMEECQIFEARSFTL